MHNILTGALVHTGDIGKVDLTGAWGKFQSTVLDKLIAPGSPISTTLTIIGVAVILGAVLKYFWDKRRGGGARGHGPIWWTLGIGGILVAPTVLLPLFFMVLDKIINIVIGVVNGSGWA